MPSWEIVLIAIGLSTVDGGGLKNSYAGRGRRLQQSSQLPTGGQCGLQFSNKSLNYSRCQSLTPLLGAGVDYNLLWTYQSRQPGMLMLALDAAVPANGYIGFGIPTTPDTMIGASAIVVKANSSAPTGVTVQQYFLGGYSTSEVKPGGTLDVQDMQGRYSGGRLQAVLSIANITPSDTTIPSITAIGTLGPNGALRQHSAESGVDLSVDGSQPQTSASPPGPAPLVSVVPQEVSTPSATPQDLDSSDERGRQSVASPPVNSLVPSPGPSTGCALPAGLNQPAQQYGSCTTLQGAAPDFQLLWSIPEDPVQPVGGRRLQQNAGTGDVNVTLAIGVTKSDGWASIGVPASPGRMVGSSAILFKTCSTCPSGADAVFRYLAAKSEAGISGAGRLNVSNIAAWAQGGRLYGSFSILLPSATSDSQPFIFASGPLSSDGICEFHADGQGGLTVDLKSGSITGTQGGESDTESAAHGWIMAISWGFLIPLGAVIARNFKSAGSCWFFLHFIIQTAGWVLGWVGFGLGVHLTDGDYSTHQAFGIVVQLLGTFQLILGFLLRPGFASNRRRLWNFSHWWIGRVAIGLGIANVYIGLIVEGQAASKYVVAYSVVLGSIAVVAFCKESHDYLSLPPPSVDIQRHPNALSTDPVTAPKPYAGLVTSRGPRTKPGNHKPSEVASLRDSSA